MNNYFVYILLCSDKTLYTGYTNNIENRLLKHNQGKASKYTRARLPVKLIYVETFFSKSDALKREASIKKKTKLEKLKLINSYEKEI